MDLLWTKLIGTSGNDYGWGVALDHFGNVFVTGETDKNLNGIIHNGGIKDAFLVKFDSYGNLLWTNFIGTNGYDYGWGVVVDHFGNVFVTGDTTGNLNGVINNGDCDAFLVKFDYNGNLLSTKLIGTNGYESGVSVAVNQEYIYVSGNFKSLIFHKILNKGNSDVFLVYEKLIYDHPCYASCFTCIGGTINDCLQCAPNYYKISTNNFPTQCYEVAPPSYYLEINKFSK